MISKQGTKCEIIPEKAVQLLKEYGTDITIEEAQIILDFMYKFAKLSINQQKRKLIIGNKENFGR